MVLQLVQFIKFLQIKVNINPKEVVLSFAMNHVQIEQAYDTLHVDLLNSIYQKSNNEIITKINRFHSIL